MDPPRSVFGNVLVGSLALGGSAWLGAALNRRSVSPSTASGGVAAAALGGTTAALITLFGASALAVGDSKWKKLGATTTILGVGGFAALSLIGLRVNDRILSAAAGGGAQALTAGEADSGKSFALKTGDTLTIELPAGQAGFAWSWTSPADSLTGPVSALASSGLEQDTWTATKAGAGKLTAQLAPTGGGPSIATWSADVSVS